MLIWNEKEKFHDIKIKRRLYPLKEIKDSLDFQKTSADLETDIKLAVDNRIKAEKYILEAHIDSKNSVAKEIHYHLWLRPESEPYRDKWWMSNGKSIT